MRLCWLSDVHLNFLPETGAKYFGEYLVEEHEFDAVVISGDIAEAHDFDVELQQFFEGVKLPTYFTLGNHDYYHGSFQSVREKARVLSTENLVWLDEAEPVQLSKTTALTGHQGWYDGVLGKAKKSMVYLSDFDLIHDFAPWRLRETWHDRETKNRFLGVLRDLGKEAADQARANIIKAFGMGDTVVFATHVPPFKGACWHEGEISDSRWLPWFTCDAMGKMLVELAVKNQDKDILVLCGHTHGSGVYKPLPNLKVLAGAAVYGAPDISGIIDV